MRRLGMSTTMVQAFFSIMAVAMAFAAGPLTSAQAPPQYPQSPPPYPQAPPSYPQGPPPYSQAPPSYPQAPPSYPPAELDRVVSRIALYPDPLIAQILTAATFYDQIPEAARWADQHHYLTGDALAQAITGDQLPWDPSVQALLPFASVLDMMASDMAWTQELGNAVLAEQPQVMDAVQRMRRRSIDYGYLRTNAQLVVTPGPYITIMPANPAFVVVPAYNPAIVFAPPRPGFVIGGAIGFGFGINIGVAFRPWGWGFNRFDWGARTIFINNRPWGRTWANRAIYAHPYAFQPYRGPRPAEHHELHERSPQEREAARAGRPRQEEHSRGGERKGEERGGEDRR
jgi:hypothetical protein